MEISKSLFFDLASLSEASYALFENVGDIKDLLIDEGFSSTQADKLLSRWVVGPHVEDTNSDFSMTLFEGVNPSDGFVLGFRGTLGPGDYITDVGDIVADGIALDQIVDLVNMWNWLNTAGDYAATKLEVMAEETALLQIASAAGAAAKDAYLTVLKLRNDVVIDLPTNTVRTVVWEQSDMFFDDEKYKQGAGYGEQIAERRLTVVGHSLGGHLAAAFTRLIPDAEADAFTVNGAGFGMLGLNGFASKNVSNLFALLS